MGRREKKKQEEAGRCSGGKKVEGKASAKTSENFGLPFFSPGHHHHSQPPSVSFHALSGLFFLYVLLRIQSIASIPRF